MSNLQGASSWSGVLPLAGLVHCLRLATQAQEFRATLSGRVTVPTGTVVVDAIVRAVNVSSRTARSASTANDGTY